MRSFTCITILAIICLPSCSANIIVCTKLHRNATCFIEGLSLQSSSDDLAIAFPSSSQIIMESCEIIPFTTHHFDALPDTAFLTLKNGLIPAVTFRSQSLHSLRIDNTGLREFAIVPQENRNLNTLIITGNPLYAIPPNIRHLVALSILDLSNNQLESVNLNWFRTMDNLLALDLSSNRIVQLDVLPTLRLQRVKNFWINHNRLRGIAFFPAFLPALQRVRLVENSWSCDWVAAARRSIWTASIEVHGAETACLAGTLNGGLCCYTADQPEPHGARYEIVSVTFDRQEASHEQLSEKLLSRPEPLREAEGPEEETQFAQLRRSYEVLGQKYRRVIEEKELLEKRFTNTVRELERTVRRLTAELGEAQNVISVNVLRGN
uniref:Uncharacterized protein n=1 Tax=Anopheles atroparvus TaxID=41427 RepID=A0A240PLI2_ANOAO